MSFFSVPAHRPSRQAATRTGEETPQPPASTSGPNTFQLGLLASLFVVGTGVIVYQEMR